MDTRFKRGMCMLLALILVLGLVACGGGGSATDRPGGDSNGADEPNGADGPSPMVASAGHVMFIQANGTLWAWGGHNNYGQYGDGTTEGRGYGAVPVQIGTDTWTSVAAGMRHTAAIRTDGSLWTWGANHNGQLGDGTMEDRLRPVQIGTDTDWASVAAGAFETVAIKADGSLWAWGGVLPPGMTGEPWLGDGSLTPVRIGTDVDWVSVSVGMARSFALLPPVALKSDGSLWILEDIPARVGSEREWASAPSEMHLGDIALKTDGSLWRIGERAGLLSPDAAPIQMGTGTDWAAHSGMILLKNDGSLWQIIPTRPEIRYMQIGTGRTWVAHSVFDNVFALDTDGNLWFMLSFHAGEVRWRNVMTGEEWTEDRRHVFADAVR